jgi:tetratricopeptide (TPR) repeat protein
MGPGAKRVLKGCGIVLGLGLLGLLLVVGVGFYFGYNALKQFEANPGYVPIAGAQCAYDRAAGDQALAVAPAEPLDFGYPNNSYDQMYVRTYVRDGLYDYLDSLLTVYTDSVRRDYRLEYRLFDLFEAYDVPDTSLKTNLDAWVAERPQSANARLVRATWLTAMGQEARGEKLARETADSSMGSLDYYLEQARKDIEAAHALNPCSLVTYHLLMQAASYSGNTILSKKLLDQALTIQPYSFMMRSRHMNSLVPRWGGSYPAMERFAAESDSLIPRNPRLRALHGFAVLDRADISERAKDTVKAMAQYDSANTFGDYWRFRLERGQYLYRLDRNEQALMDLERALEQRPQLSDILRYLSDVHYDIGRLARGDERAQHYAEAYRYVNLALAISPTDPALRKSLAFYLKNIPEFAPKTPGG